MNTFSKYLLILGGLILVAVGVSVVTQQAEQNTPTQPESIDDRPTVGTSIFPLYDITRTIAGDALNVTILLPAGTSPHTFEPSPSLLKTIADTDVIYQIGYGLDAWINDLAAAESVDTLIVDHNIEIRNADDHEETDQHHEEEEDDHHDDKEGDDHDDEEEDGHGHGSQDPHYWLTYANAQEIARTITDDLTTRYPEHAELFDTNLTEWIEDLERAEIAARKSLTSLENTQIVTFHDAWYYFAEGLGLTVAGTYEPTAGRAPTPKYLADLTEGLKHAGTTTVYSEPQFGTANLSAFAQDNGLTIVELDPIGGVEGRETFISLMQHNVNIITQHNDARR